MGEQKTVLKFRTPLGDVELPALPPLPPLPLSKSKALGSSNPDPVATPTLTITITITAWDVEITVYVEVAGETRLAMEGETEVTLNDIGEGLDTTLYSTTGWRPNGAGGIVRFNNAEFPWINGFDGTWGANRFHLQARLTGQPSIVSPVRELYLSRTDWSPK